MTEQNWQADPPQPAPDAGQGAQPGPTIFTPNSLSPDAASEPQPSLPAWQPAPPPAASPHQQPQAPAAANWPPPPSEGGYPVPQPPAQPISGPAWQAPPAAPYGPAGGALPPPTGMAGSPQNVPQAGFPAYASAQASGETESKSIVALILALGSFVLCPVFLAVAALVLAHQSDQAIAASGGRLGGKGMNTASRWIAGVNIVLSVLGLLAVLFFAIVLAVNSPEIIENLPSPGSTNF